MDKTEERPKRASTKRKKLTLGKGVKLEQLLENWTQCNYLMEQKGKCT
jgi:hypothetical protein